ncbi:response regulator transcription factor [Rhodalgimonas zhirmunskyi]|uniref:Response regulator transcription factor n=1 Tax=Rhodalgimonas zhirmunskyi TaxID=2964767 RepID=A0AAJ1UE35_9RHOB|nr:response regulator transcription factor [Rhodoalgimonas zhirmunskyi]MDQ2094382.1 response regulator transcription factor [Rhodoalgimonas zhirmunskyi]
MADILIIDDDPQIRQVLRIALKQAGHQTREAGDGPEGLAKALNGRDDLIVLDVGLPGMDGFELCRRLRAEREVPVLFLTARDDEIDRVLGLELGGDDYVTKPFSARELTARIRAILKRSGTGGGQASPERMKRGALEIDPARHLCRFAGQDVALTQREMGILAQLMARPENVWSKAQLSDAVYGPSIHVSERTLDSHLRNLRAKLAEAGAGGAIETVHGVGLRMGACETA